MKLLLSSYERVNVARMIWENVCYRKQNFAPSSIFVVGMLGKIIAGIILKFIYVS
jgi:hypothetical protein